MKLGSWFVPALLVFSTLSHAESDPLFEKMKGDWTGDGTRIQSISGRRTELHIRSLSVIQGDRLVSSSEITELDPPQSYHRSYWVRFSGKASYCGQSAERAYELGVGNGPVEKVLSHGCFGGDRFQVDQELAAEPPFIIRSTTRFESEGVSIYDEVTRHGEHQLSQAQIRYKRQE